jgi:hypothetical protein
VRRRGDSRSTDTAGREQGKFQQPWFPQDNTNARNAPCAGDAATGGARRRPDLLAVWSSRLFVFGCRRRLRPRGCSTGLGGAGLDGAGACRPGASRLRMGQGSWDQASVGRAAHARPWGFRRGVPAMSKTSAASAPRPQETLGGKERPPAPR